MMQFSDRNSGFWRKISISAHPSRLSMMLLLFANRYKRDSLLLPVGINDRLNNVLDSTEFHFRTFSYEICWKAAQHLSFSFCQFSSRVMCICIQHSTLIRVCSNFADKFNCLKFPRYFIVVVVFECNPPHDSIDQDGNSRWRECFTELSWAPSRKLDFVCQCLKNSGFQELHPGIELLKRFFTS